MNEKAIKNFIDESQQNKVAILTNPNPGTMTLPNKHSRNFVKQLQPRLNAYKSLLNVYQEFNLLTDSKFGDKTKDAASALITSFNSINQLPDLPSAVSSMLPEVSKTISQSIQAKKVKKHNEILLAITNAYLKLWTEEEPLWDAYIDAVYDDYSSGLNSVPSEYFGAEKIKQNNVEPYSNDTIVILMYRLDKRDEIIIQKNDLKKQLSDFGKALADLDKAHAELAKEKTDISDVILH